MTADTTTTRSSAAPAARRRWIAPTSESRGSVAQLVQIAKRSGHTDCGNTRLKNSGVFCNE